MGTVYNTNVVTDGIKFYWDAANRRSYPGAGTTWTDPAGGIKSTLENEDDDALNFNSFKGGCFEFDGTDGRVDCGDAGIDNKLIVDWGELSVCVWALAIQGSQSSYGLVYLGNPFEFSIAPPAHQRFIWATIDGTSLTADVGCIDPYWGKWAHYAVRWVTGTDNYRLYINGEVIKTGTFNDTHISPGSNPPLYFAYRGTGKCLEGNMGSVYIYDRALSDDEIKQNYEATKSRFEPRITKRGMNLNFDAGDPASYPGGTSWKDTANGLSTTFHNMDASNFNSINGGYFDFDGTDEWMTAPHSSLFQSAIADQGTFAAWFNIDAAEADNADVPIWGAGRDGGRMIWSMAQYNGNKKMHFGAYLAGSWAPHGDTATALSYDTWYYIVYTWDKANTEFKAYVNGALDSTDTPSSVSITTSSTGWLGIGASLYSTSNGSTPFAHLNGFLGVLQLYDSVLSAAEIMDNFQKTRGRFGV